MPKAVKVREGAGYLPKMDIGDLGRMRDLLPCGRPRLRVQAAILRKGGRGVGGMGTAPGENPSAMHNRPLRLAEGGMCRTCDGPGTGRPCRPADDEGPRPGLFICNGPQACGYARDSWTSGLPARHTMQCLGGEYGASGLPDLVSRTGYPVREPRPVPYRSAPPGEQAEFGDVTRQDQTGHRKVGYKVPCLDACAKADSPPAGRGMRTRGGGSDTASASRSERGIQMPGMPGDGTLDLAFSETCRSGDAMRMIRHVHEKYGKVYRMVDNAGPNTAAAVPKYAAESGGDVVLRYILPYTPRPSPTGPQWAAIRGGVGGTYFGGFGSVQECTRDAPESGEIPAVRLQGCLTDPASRRGETGVGVICTTWPVPPCVWAGPGARSRTRGSVPPPMRPFGSGHLRVHQHPAPAAVCRRPCAGPARSHPGRTGGIGRVAQCIDHRIGDIPGSLH